MFEKVHRQRALFALCTSLLSYALAATDGGGSSLAGTILDKATSEPVPGAQVWLPDLRRGTVSGADGSYLLTDLPPAKLLVKVSMLGYGVVTEVVDVAITAKHDFALSASVTEMNDVVVTGSSKATERAHDPTPTVLIDPRYLTLHASTNAVEALGNVPGLSTWTTGPNVSKPIIRGLGSNRMLTLFDGVRQEGQQWGEEHGVELDQFLIDRVEVVKGPASLMYGSDALAGVVNFIPAPSVEAGVVRGAVTSGYGSNNKAIIGSIDLDGNNNGLIWGARLSRKQATNYQNRYDGRVAGTKYNENDASAYLGLDRSWGYAHARFSLYDDEQEIPDGSRDSTSRRFTQQVSEEDTLRPIIPDDVLGSYTIGAVRQHVQHYRASLSGSVMLGEARLATQFGFQRSVRREYGHPQAPDVPALFLELNSFTYDVKYHLAEKNGWEPTVGVNGMFQSNKVDRGTEFIIPSCTVLDAGPFAHVRKRFGRFDLSAGLRFDTRRYEGSSLYTRTDPATGFEQVVAADPDDAGLVRHFDAFANTYTGASGSAGTAFSVNEQFIVKANIARGYRAPNVAELSALGVHPGTGIQQLGDAELRPEFSLQQDLGFFYSGSHLNASVELFHNAITDYIYNEKLLSVGGDDSLFTQGGEEFPVYKFRQTGARLIGAEFSMDVHPHPFDWLHFENTVSAVLADNTGGAGIALTAGTRYLPTIPPVRFTSELRADLKRPLGRLSRIFVRLAVRVTAAQDRYFAAYGTETYTPGYTLVDAGAGADVRDGKDRTLFSFIVSGTNLADLAYQSNMSRLKYFEDYPNNGTGRSGIYNMGRNIDVRITVPFGWKMKAAKPE